jgi:GT2 family glycosyltransferase
MRDDIEKCLSSLFSETANTSLKIMVHVIDNSENEDGIKEFVEENFPQVKYIDMHGNVGFGKSQNAGFKNAQAKYYLALNPDVEFIDGQNTIERFFNYMEENESVGVAGPKTLNLDGSVQLTCNRFFDFFDQIARRLGLGNKIPYFKKKVDRYLMADFNHDKTVKVDWIIGSFMFLRGSLALELGFFDDRFFMYFEDCDLCRRTWHKNFDVMYLHDIKVKHGHRRDSAEKFPLLSILTNRVTRIHIKSWLQYFLKWGFKKERYGR